MVDLLLMATNAPLFLYSCQSTVTLDCLTRSLQHYHITPIPQSV